MWAWLGLALAVPMPRMQIQPVELRVEARELCYPSGLKVVAIRRPESPLVSVSMVVDGGWAAEADGERGAAHLVEHLWFQARPQGSWRVDELLAGLRGHAFTWADETVYTTLAAPEDLPKLLTLEALRLQDPLSGVTDDVFTHEREIVSNEHRYRSDHVVGVAWRALAATLYPEGSPYADPPALEANEAATLAAISGYASRQYRAANATLRLEGDLDLAGLDGWIAAAFPSALLSGSVTSCDRPVPSAVPPTPAADREVPTVHVPARPGVLFGWTLPPGWSAEGDALGAEAAAWLEDVLPYAIDITRGVDDQDIGLSCRYEARLGPSLLVCGTQLSPGSDAGRVVSRVSTSLDDRRVEMAEDEAWLLRTAKLAHEHLAQADAFDPETLAERARFSHRVSGEQDPLFRIATTANNAGVPALRSFAKEWLTRDRIAGVGWVYEAAEPGEGAVVDGHATLTGQRLGDWTPPSVELTGWSQASLPTGLDVWTISKIQGAPVSSARAWFGVSGAVGEPAAWWGDRHTALADLPVLALLNETATHAWYATRPGQAAMRAAGPPGNLDAQLFTVRRLIGPVHYIGRPSDLKADHVEARKSLRTHPLGLVPELVGNHLFPDHVAGAAWWELDEAARRITRGDLHDWRRALLRPELGALVVSGRVAPDLVAAEVERYFGDWEVRSPATATTTPPTAALERARYAVEVPWLPRVQVACRIAGRTPENDAAQDVLEALLERGMTQTLRDRGGGYAYGVDLRTEDPTTATLTLSAEVGPESGRTATDALLDLLWRIDVGPSEALLALGRSMARTTRAEQLASANTAAAVATAAIASGATLEQLVAWEARLAAVDKAALHAVLEPCIGREVAVVIGPRRDLGEDVTWVDVQALANAIAR